MPCTPTNEDECPAHSDAILPMRNPYMTQITTGQKNYESRKYRLNPVTKRLWFYRTAPHSALTHICEICPARTRNDGDEPLEDGLGNGEFNARHVEWEGFDFAYRLLTVYELLRPIGLNELRGLGVKAAPRGWFICLCRYGRVLIGGSRSW